MAVSMKQEAGSVLETWLNKVFAGGFLRSAPQDRREHLLPLDYSLYITNDDLKSRISENATKNVRQMDVEVSQKVGVALFSQFSQHLEQQCQISYSDKGDSVIQAAILQSSNIAFPWPTVFGNPMVRLCFLFFVFVLPLVDLCFGRPQKMTDFWCDKRPEDRYENELRTCSVCPLRIVRTEHYGAQLVVDIRWLLLISALAGNSPSQSSVTLLVAQWVQVILWLHFGFGSLVFCRD